MFSPRKNHRLYKPGLNELTMTAKMLHLNRNGKLMKAFENYICLNIEHLKKCWFPTFEKL